MALVTQSLGNSPCSISRGVSGVAADGTLRRIRVGLSGTPYPVGYTGEGSLDNPIFFKKVLEAGLVLIGSNNPADLSNVSSLANVFWMASREGNTALLAQLRALFPNGNLLELPFVENAAAMVYDVAPLAIAPQWGTVMFENTGGASAPTYCDFVFIVSAAEDQTDNSNYIVKLFHSLTA